MLLIHILIDLSTSVINYLEAENWKNGLFCYSFDDFIDLGTKQIPKVYGCTTKEHEHHQTGSNGPLERIVGTQDGRMYNLEVV